MDSEDAAAAIVRSFGPWAFLKAIELRPNRGLDGYTAWLASRCCDLFQACLDGPAFGLYDCPRCMDAVVDLREHLTWCQQ